MTVCSKILSIVAATLMSVGPAWAQELTVSAAVSLREALIDLETPAERKIGHPITLNFAASGQLLAQIREGAPVDVYISAADAQMDQAAAANLILPGTRRVIAGNLIVLIVPAEAESPVRAFADLANDAVKQLAVGEPRTVPAGAYAMQVLQHLKIADALAGRLIAGASVRQVLDYVERGEVNAGIVYATDAQQAGAKVKVVAAADETWHRPIRYPAAVVAASPRQKPAQAFVEYLLADEAQAALRKRGFAPPATQPATQQAASPESR